MAEKEKEQFIDEEPEKLGGDSGEPYHAEASSRGMILISLAALGIVYGDIGTSPLYALRECFGGQHSVSVTPDHVFGVLSLIFWSLLIIISIKYSMYVMRMDNRGEGGILALMALLPSWHRTDSRSMVMILGVIGAALLYGDGIITPAISVLSAIEGLKVATPAFEPYILPITVAILILLFAFQRRGTSAIGSVFGPIMLVWFTVNAVLGVSGIVSQPQVLSALTPNHAIHFLINNHFQGFLVLGAVFLSVTGGEALYADLGHFGAKPIRVAWFALVLPSLVLNYFGQGAQLLTTPESSSPFYDLAPSWAVYPLVLLATMATVIASQAVISGVFSLSRQAALLGLSPRLKVVQTSARKIGQIYVPGINWLMMVATVALVLGFGTSSRLSGAYGVAVSATMVITTLLAYFVTREVWRWSRGRALAVTAAFLAVDLTFFCSNMFRIVEGGWVPITVGVLVFVIMTTWKRGRDVVKRRLARKIMPLDTFVQQIQDNPPHRVPGTAVFMSAHPEGIPPILLHHLKHSQVLHEKVILLTIVTQDVPRLRPKDRLEVSNHGSGIYRVILNLGFMNVLTVPEELRRAREHRLDIDLDTVTYYVGRTILVPAKDDRVMAVWREKLFMYLARNAAWSASFYGLPQERVIELGEHVQL